MNSNEKNHFDFTPIYVKNTYNKERMSTTKEKNKIDFFSKKSKENNMNTNRKNKRKYKKSGYYTKESILKRKMEKIFNKFENLYNEVGENWYEKLENLPSVEEKQPEVVTTRADGKRKYTKSGRYTKDAIFGRKITKLTGKFNKITNEAESALKEEKSWYNNLKESITNLFFRQEAKFELDKKAWNVTKRFVVDLKEHGMSLMDPLNVLKKVKPLVFEKFKENPKTKQNLSLICLMEKLNPLTGEKVIKEANFNSKYKEIFEGSNLQEIYQKMTDEIIIEFEGFLENGSMWNFAKSLKVVANINKIKILGASSYIPLPIFLEKKKAIVNPKNDDQKCLLWCVAIHNILKINPNFSNPERLPKIIRMKTKKFDLNGVNFPCRTNDIEKFERNNNISINVVGYNEEKRGIYPLRVGKKTDLEKYVNLLLIGDENGKKHFCLIKNLSRLISSQINKNKKKCWICFSCLQPFVKKKTLEEHFELCSKFKCVKTEFPKKGETLKFKNFMKIHNIPFVIYADFECYLKRMFKNIGGNTTQFQKHEPSGFCYLIKCFDDKLFKPKLVRYTKKHPDEDLGLIFTKSLEKEIRKIYQQFKFPKMISMTGKDEENFKDATKCYACGEKYKTEYIVKYNKYDDNVKIISKLNKVADHCHFTGKYQGAACVKCNSLMRKPKFFPIILHNLQNYDTHLFIKSLGITEGEIKCIAKTEEKYISFSKEIIVDEFYSKRDQKTVYVKRQLRFIDSLKFMASSLGKLAKNLGEDDFNMMKTFFEDEEKRQLLTRKGVFPYDWFDSMKKLEERNLPPIHEFYSKLDKENISEADYQHAKKVWETFNMKSMKEYHDLYLKTDVLLLADVFESFREVSKENYELDPAWYYTLPGLAWEVMLKISKVELELIHDPEMYDMIEDAIRGGISNIKRYAKANNPYMGEKFDPEKEKIYIPYLDANGLYSWAMTNPLPVRNFKWMEKEELENWREFPCILKVDLEYPEELHELHNEYPLAPERLKVGNVEKLIPNLHDKKEYNIHYKNLKLYESLGMKITKIHKGVKFEEDFMKKYIDKNIDLRKNAKNEFERDFFKFMNNSVFGKTMENVRNRVDIQLISSEEKALKLFSKPNFDKRTIFSENLIAVHMHRKKLKLNKPIYLGMSILELSKTLMFDFHYNYIKPKYGKNAKLLFTDTDSLMYEIKTDDFYKDISPDVESKFDTRNYDKNHPSGIPTGKNKQVVGMMKDECDGELVLEFVGLRPKVYNYSTKNKEEKRCKGVKKSVVKNELIMQDYKDCLFGRKEKTSEMNLIRHRNHDLFTERIEKVSLSSNDDKRIILENKIDTLAYGHYKTLKQSKHLTKLEGMYEKYL